MILYTIQPEFKYLELENTGILKAHDSILCYEGIDKCYSWLENKMLNLLPKPEIECIHPIWAWYVKNNKRKPDLRQSGYIEKGKPAYRIEFEVPDNEVLLTCFDYWHLVLNASDSDISLGKTVFEKSDFDEEYIQELLDDKWNLNGEFIEFNWDNIILNKDSTKKDIQATIWYIKKSQIKKVDKFIAK